MSGSEEGGKVRFWAGSPTPDNAPFRVHEDGKVRVIGEVNATSGNFENVTISGALRTPWKELEYKLIYTSATGDVYGYDGSAFYDDRLIIAPVMTAEIKLGWGESANGREVVIRVKDVNGRNAYIEVPSGKKAVGYDGTIIGEGEKIILDCGYIYYLTGFSDCWVVRERVSANL